MSWIQIHIFFVCDQEDFPSHPLKVTLFETWWLHRFKLTGRCLLYFNQITNPKATSQKKKKWRKSQNLCACRDLLQSRWVRRLSKRFHVALAAVWYAENGGVDLIPLDVELGAQQKVAPRSKRRTTLRGRLEREAAALLLRVFSKTPLVLLNQSGVSNAAQTSQEVQ